MKPHFRVASAVTLLVSLSLAGCGGGDNSSSNDSNSVADSFDFLGMYANYTDNIIIPGYQTVEQNAALISAPEGPLAEYCESIGTTEEAAAFSAAESHWRDLQNSIQQTESHILGPATDNGSVLANRLNGFTAGSLSTCGIDQAVVLASEQTDFDTTSRAVNQRGIGTLEYLLFNTDLSHSCPSQIIETQNWNDRPETERKRLRCEYALLIADDIEDAAETLVMAWERDEGNYRSTFLNPLNSADSLESLSDAMFFIELDVKDNKLGIPLGINSGCSAISCPERVESPYSQTSLQNIRTNILAFERMLTGGDGLGFDDIITEAGVSDLNTRFFAHIDAALASIDGQPMSLADQAQTIADENLETECINAYTNPETLSVTPACNLFGYLKRITDELKIGFTAAVNVDLPERGQSDND